jgi:protocatechuate 3,4-dioxygenase beta subunit
LRRAQITLTSAEPGQQTRRVTTTDGEGRYEFAEVPEGRFSISATKAGYVTLQYGQRRPFETGTPLNVSDGQSLERIDFGLPRGSVISVRISDEFGEPVAGVMVQVQRYQYGPDGQRRLSSVPGAATPFATTDDRGEFRAFGLMPGEYVVLATMRGLGSPTGSNPNDSNEGFSPTFYPGTISSEQAQAISLGVGEEQAIAFSMIAARMGRLSGVVVDSEGQPAAGASLSIVTVTGTGMSSSMAGTVAPDGSFTITGIAPGEHTLRVDRRRGTAAGEFASVPVTVGSNDVTGVRVSLGAGTRVTGRVIWEGTAARTGGPVPPRVSAQQVDPQRQLAMIGGSTDPLANGTPDDEGNFTLAGVAGRVFFTMAPAPPAWMVKSVTLAGDDITDLPMDLTGIPSLSDLRIVLTDKLTTVSGQVKDQRGQLLKDYVVVILGAQPQEPVIAARSTRVIRPDNTGRFQVRGVRPGRYVAAAVEALEQGRQYAPEFQQQLRRAAREFSVGEGETANVDLMLTPDL